MKKLFPLILSIAIIIIALFLIFKVFDIFGFWTLIWTGLASIFASAFLNKLARSRSELNDVVTFNPKEWPKFINILVSISIGLYLLSILNSKEELNKAEYLFGFGYLIFLTFIPLIKAIYTLIRDRNDFISISATTIKYKDNDDVGEFSLSQIAGAQVIKGDINLVFTNGDIFTVKTSNMNFGRYDIQDTLREIKNRMTVDTVIEDTEDAEAEEV